ncbi:hypothetical protein EAO70_12935 [Streptomyces sp. adm13(2018)]|uniref:hypothetical protein n=1 Tax=Streptomyces sp. adm13(2018) TaxID=2479007 RepID=UPI0011CE238B|nr:hypothetical protein [Streptomyces sp. adm13(2018)]TXS16338.1 hypothetical protein EAO70_12935 [Streptomyces sp. adm13(2018)]
MTQAMELAQILLGCLETQLQAPHPWPVPEDRVMLRAGEQVIPLASTSTDECCTGLGYVRIAGIQGVRDVTDRMAASGCFMAERLLTLELGVYRCIPTPAAGAIVTAEQWSEAALKLDADWQAMEAAVCCAFDDPDSLRIGPVAVGLYEPIGPDANCIGGKTTVNIVMEACC